MHKYIALCKSTRRIFQKLKTESVGTIAENLVDLLGKSWNPEKKIQKGVIVSL